METDRKNSAQSQENGDRGSELVSRWFCGKNLIRIGYGQRRVGGYYGRNTKGWHKQGWNSNKCWQEPALLSFHINSEPADKPVAQPTIWRLSLGV